MRNGFFVATILAVVLLALPAQAAQPYAVVRAGAYPSSGFGITSVLQTPDRIYPGDEVQLQFQVVNQQPAGAHAVELNLLVPFISQAAGYTATTLNYPLGDMQPNIPKNITVSFVVSNDTKPGTYDIYAYEYDSQGTQAQIADIPIVINEPVLSNAIIADANGIPDVTAGDTATFPIRLRNVGPVTATDIVVQMLFNANNVLTPIGSDRQYVAALAPGENATDEFQVGINPQATPGFYPVTILISYKADKNTQPVINQTFGIKVVSQAQLLITSEVSSSSATTTTGTGGSGGLVITVANVGDTPVRSVYVKADSQSYGFTGANDKFIGTLNLDDSATLSLSPFARGQAAVGSAGTINVVVTYKDALNVEHTQTQVVTPANVRATGTGTDANGNANGQRFGRQSQGFTIFGMDPLYLAVGIAILVGAFFGYKWYTRRGKK